MFVGIDWVHIETVMKVEDILEVYSLVDYFLLDGSVFIKF